MAKKLKPPQSKLVRLPVDCVQMIDAIRAGLPAYYERADIEVQFVPKRDVDIIALALAGLRRRVEEK